ncbi:hypothetical protein MMPV_003338 [Pyropia vietnamensis]
MGLTSGGDTPPPLHTPFPSLSHLPTDCLAAVGRHLDSGDLTALARTDAALARHLGALPGDAARASDLWANLYGAAYRARVPAADAGDGAAGDGRVAVAAPAGRPRHGATAGSRLPPPLPSRDAYLRAEAAARGWRLRSAPPTDAYTLFPGLAAGGDTPSAAPAALSVVSTLLPLPAWGGRGAPGWGGAAAIVGGRLAVVPPPPPRRAARSGVLPAPSPSPPPTPVPSTPAGVLTCLAVAPGLAGVGGVRLVGGSADRCVRVWSSEPDGAAVAAGRAAWGWVGGRLRSPPCPLYSLDGSGGDLGGTADAAAAVNAAAADAAVAAVGHPPRVLRGHTSAVTAVAAHPGVPKLAATGGRDGTVRLWRNKAAGAPLRGAGDWVTTLAWVGGGEGEGGSGGGGGSAHLVAGTRGGVLALWDVTARAVVATAAVPPPASGTYPPVAVSGPVVYAAAVGAAVHVWDTRVPASSAAAAVLSAPTDVVATGRSRRRVAITSLALSADGSGSGAPRSSTAPSPLHTVAVCRHRLVGACDGGVLAWSLSAPEGALPAIVAGGGGGGVTSAALPPPAPATDDTRGGVKRRAAAPPAVRELEGALEVGADALAGLVSAVSSFGVDGQADLFAKFVRDLRHIDVAGAAVPDTVPLEVLAAVDRGRNPEAVTKDTLYVRAGVRCRVFPAAIGSFAVWFIAAV